MKYVIGDREEFLAKMVKARNASETMRTCAMPVPLAMLIAMFFSFPVVKYGAEPNIWTFIGAIPFIASVIIACAGLINLRIFAKSEPSAYRASQTVLSARRIPDEAEVLEAEQKSHITGGVFSYFLGIVAFVGGSASNAASTSPSSASGFLAFASYFFIAVGIALFIVGTWEIARGKATRAERVLNGYI